MNQNRKSRGNKVENKTTYLKFRCKENEKNKVVNKAKTAGYSSVSDFIRDRCLNDSTIVINTSEFLVSLLKLNGEINKIGNNINQFTKAINAEVKGNSRVSEDSFNNMVAQIVDYNNLMQDFDKDIKKLLRHTSRSKKG